MIQYTIYNTLTDKLSFTLYLSMVTAAKENVWVFSSLCVSVF